MVHIREPGPHDAAALGRVHVAAWQTGYRGIFPDEQLAAMSVEEREQAWTRILDHPSRPGMVRLVATLQDDGPVVGFAVAGPARHDETVGELHALNVDPDVWGRGVGGALLEAATDHLIGQGFETAVLWVATGNVRARRFYERAGWRDDEVEREEEVLGVTAHERRYRRDLPADAPS